MNKSLSTVLKLYNEQKSPFKNLTIPKIRNPLKHQLKRSLDFQHLLNSPYSHKFYHQFFQVEWQFGPAHSC